jgi:hypothetical protein
MEEVLRVLPPDFGGHVTMEEKDCQVFIIHHTKPVNPKQIYENLGIVLHGSLLLPLFLFK